MKKFIITIVAFYSLVGFSFNPPTDVDKILNSGDGKTITTAYKVNSVEEEYDLLRHLKLKPIMQKLYIKEGDYYDAILTNSGTLYFKIVIKKIFNKNVPLVI